MRGGEKQNAGDEWVKGLGLQPRRPPLRRRLKAPLLGTTISPVGRRVVLRRLGDFEGSLKARRKGGNSISSPER